MSLNKHLSLKILETPLSFTHRPCKSDLTWTSAVCCTCTNCTCMLCIVKCSIVTSILDMLYTYDLLYNNEKKKKKKKLQPNKPHMCTWPFYLSSAPTSLAIVPDSCRAQESMCVMRSLTVWEALKAHFSIFSHSLEDQTREKTQRVHMSPLPQCKHAPFSKPRFKHSNAH